MSERAQIADLIRPIGSDLGLFSHLGSREVDGSTAQSQTDKIANVFTDGPGSSAFIPQHSALYRAFGGVSTPSDPVFLSPPQSSRSGFRSAVLSRALSRERSPPDLRENPLDQHRQGYSDLHGS